MWEGGEGRGGEGRGGQCRREQEHEPAEERHRPNQARRCKPRFPNDSVPTPPPSQSSPTHTAAPTLNRAFRHASPVQGLDKVLPLTLEHVQAAYAMGCWGKSMRYSNGLLNLRQVGSPAKGYRRISVKIQGFLDIRFLRDEFSRQGLPKVAKF